MDAREAELRARWSRENDAAVVAALGVGQDSLSELTWRVLREEAAKRGLNVPELTVQVQPEEDLEPPEPTTLPAAVEADPDVWTVEPTDPIPAAAGRRPKPDWSMLKSMGCFGLVVALVGSVIWGGTFAIIALAASLAIGYWVARSSHRRAVSAWEAQLWSAERSKASETAELAVAEREAASRLVRQLSRKLKKASACLEQAEAEYTANAYGPFWDVVEEGASDLGSFAADTRSISASVRKYGQLLKGRKHTFPPISIDPASIPDPASVLSELQRLVRLGQTNFQFALIWEQRRTRQVLIEGFGTLGEALAGLASSIDGSVAELQGALVQEMSKQRDETRAARDAKERSDRERNKILESMQHRRK